ncbi:putative oxidoreductase [Lyophyllum shimeji]|uniref:3-dehydrosphinganine reductase n=1 Tax=Lyophyllum shimeji TaxID=47721 RepID=A0A9P3PZ29_LYOSH|nr:putative oxidoreductase [Lyophyllum shimeji]
MFFSSKWNPEGLHCYITGGSTGLGLSLAILLTQKGAHVSIVARNQEKLDTALTRLEEVRKSSEQILKAYSFSLNTAKDSAAALEAVCAPHNGQSPDAIFACAGASKPMFFVEMEEQDMTDGMTSGYWVQAWTAFAAAKQMARQQRKGKIVFVSSTLGYMSFLGWSSYSPAKHALRGLTDTLQSELMLYGIDVHCFFPPTMFTPGYDVENETKPKIVREIESTDDGLTADQAALALFRGVECGQVHITGDLITTLFRSSTRGASPRNNWIMDGLYDFAAYIATPIWRMSVDSKVVAHREEHREYLRQKGFFG